MDTSKLKPFDLEKAKQGKPFIHYRDMDNKYPRTFIGVRPNRCIVYEKGYNVEWCMPEYLRMLPEVKKINCFMVRVLSTNNGFNQVTVWVDSPSARRYLNEHPTIYKLLKEFEVEYDEE